jgi:hypothetical protein
MEEIEEPQETQPFEPVSTTSSPPLTKIEDPVTIEGMGILQKVLFLAVITGCVAVYLRMSKVKESTNQGYEKSLV